MNKSKNSLDTAPVILDINIFGLVSSPSTHPLKKTNKAKINERKYWAMLCDWSEGNVQKFSQFWPKKKKKQPKTWHKLVTAQPSNNNIVHMVLSIFLIKLDFTGFFCFVFSQHFLQPSNLEVSSLMFSVLWNSSDFLTFWGGHFLVPRTLTFKMRLSTNLYLHENRNSFSYLSMASH